MTEHANSARHMAIREATSHNPSHHRQGGKEGSTNATPSPNPSLPPAVDIEMSDIFQQDDHLFRGMTGHKPVHDNSNKKEEKSNFNVSNARIIPYRADINSDTKQLTTTNDYDIESVSPQQNLSFREKMINYHNINESNQVSSHNRYETTSDEGDSLTVRRGRKGDDGVVNVIDGGKYRKRRKRYGQSRRQETAFVDISDDSSWGSGERQGDGRWSHSVPARGSVSNGRRYRRERFISLSCSSIMSVVWHRTTLLVCLLLLQSLSQLILETYEHLISQHIIVPLFLTMLVGAGGNAGNQAAVRAITGLMAKEFHQRDFLKVFRKEMIVGVINASILATIAFLRVYYFYGHKNLFYSILAITLSLFCTVVASVGLGCFMPFAIGYFGHDREHAAPIIQVLMDICGVLITCVICSNMIPDSEESPAHKGVNNNRTVVLPQS
eukprot:Tbor_TRINITY_DN5390_c1_g6::TRINITY_DN5390_c1_g6_i2::g.5146::m.5146